MIRGKVSRKGIWKGLSEMFKDLREIYKKHQELISVFIILYIFFLLQMIISFRNIGPECFGSILYALYNIWLFLPILLFILLITRRYFVCILVPVISMTIIYLIDECVYQTRGRHICYYDIYNTKNAMMVAGQYHFTVTVRMIFYIGLCVITCIYVIKTLGQKKFKENPKIFFAIAIPLSLLFIELISPHGTLYQDIDENTYDVNGFTEYAGVAYSFYDAFCSSKTAVRKDLKDPDIILSEYETTKGEEDIRYIIIMNEALSDYYKITNQEYDDPLSIIKEREDIYEGTAYASVWGGGTSESEWEFLTGCTKYFFKEGYTPYMSSMNLSDIYCMTRDKEESYAIHPYFKDSYYREDVYRKFGFKDYISLEDIYEEKTGQTIDTKKWNVHAFPEMIAKAGGIGGDMDYIRGLVSDKTFFQEVLSLYRKTNSPLIFGITIQNHGGYAIEDFDATAYTDNEEVNQYLTLVKISMDAYLDFIEEMKESDDKTVILMFGDHQPYIEDVGKTIQGLSGETIEEKIQNYKIPYFIWSNFDMDMDVFPKETSLNYLSALLKQASGDTLTPFDNFRLSVSKEYPVLTQNFLIDKEGNIKYQGEENDILDDYCSLQQQFYQ